MPSEYPRYLRWAACASPTRSRASSTACLICFLGSSGSNAAHLTRFSRPLRNGWNPGPSTSAPTCGSDCSAPSGSGRPSSSISPCVGRTNPSSIRIVVVLPDPLGPSMPSTAPSGSSRSTRSTATVLPYSLRRPLVRAATTGFVGAVTGALVEVVT